MKSRKTIIFSIFVLLVVSVVINFKVIEVNESSMEPNLLDKELGLMIKKSKLERFDIVIIKKENYIIKRIIGLPNETIFYNQGLYVDGKLIEESFLSYDQIICTNTSSTYNPCSKSIVIPDDSYFVMGDNRKVSIDSRYFGFIKKEEIIGEVVLMFGKKGASKIRVV